MDRKLDERGSGRGLQNVNAKKASERDQLPRNKGKLVDMNYKGKNNKYWGNGNDLLNNYTRKKYRTNVESTDTCTFEENERNSHQPTKCTMFIWNWLWSVIVFLRLYEFGPNTSWGIKSL